MLRKLRKGLASTRAKLILINIVLSISSLALLGLITYNKSYNVLNSRFKKASTETLKEVDRSLDEYFNGLRSYVDLLSGIDYIRNFNEEKDITKIEEILVKAKGNNPNLLNVYIATADKHLIDDKGIHDGNDYDQTTKQWYINAINSMGKVVISEPYKDASGEKNTVSLSKAITKDGEVIGVLSVDIKLEELSKNLSKVKMGENGYIFVTDKAGNMIAHLKHEYIGTDIAKKQSFWSEASNSKEGFYEYEFEGFQMYAISVTNMNTGWKLFASINQSELMDDVKSIKEISLILAICFIIASVISASIFAEIMARRINKIKHSIALASKGDLSSRINLKSKDEFGELAHDINNMFDEVSLLISNVKDSSEVINKTSSSIKAMAKETSTAVNEVAKTIDQVAAGSYEQAKNIEESAEELKNLAGRIEDISKLVKDMSTISESTNKLSKKGIISVDRLIEKSELTANSTNDVSDAVKVMNTTTLEISTITGTINSIAEQTNLLALNAAIEAARAGESGRGFAVVADEVRKLAEQSKKATEQIQELLSAIRARSLKAVEAIDITRANVDEQLVAVEDSKENFNEILNSVADLITMINNVQVAIEETNINKDHIVDKMQGISAISEETAASTEEVSSSTEEVSSIIDEFDSNASILSDLSIKLQEQIDNFKL